MLISKYGFNDVLETGRVVLHPSRVAAQIVTGVGFLGAGLIFVRRDSVRGLTTAASIWVTAAVGACAGAGLPVLAVLATGTYALVALGFPVLVRRLPRSSTATSVIRIRYHEGQGVLRTVLQTATSSGFAVEDLSTELIGRDRADQTSGQDHDEPSLVEVTLHVHGKGLVNELAALFAEIDGITAVVAGDVNLVPE